MDKVTLLVWCLYALCTACFAVATVALVKVGRAIRQAKKRRRYRELLKRWNGRPPVKLTFGPCSQCGEAPHHLNREDAR